MKKILLFFFALLGIISSAKADEVAIKRDNWKITAYANPSSAIEGEADGRAEAAIDGKADTFFHSDWSGSQLGKGCPQAFQIEMAQAETVSKISFLPRSNGAGAPLSYRIYVSNTSTDLTALTSSTKDAALSAATLKTTLGDPAASGNWADNATLKEATLAANATGKYILFVADNSHGSDAKWLCCAEFNAYKNATAYKVTYEFYVGDEKIGTTTTSVEVGDVYPDITIPSTVICSSDYYELSEKPEGTVNEDKVVTITVTQKTPFTISPSFADANWHTLQFDSNNNYFISYTENAEKIELNRKTTEGTDADLFCFVGNIFEGFRIYNKAAGDGYLLSSSADTDDGNTGGSTYATMVATATAETQAYLWDVTKGTNGFYLGQHNNNGGKNRLNNRGSNLAYWVSGAGTGSDFLAKNAADYSKELSDAISTFESLYGNNPGYYNAEGATPVVEAAKTKTTSTSISEIVAAQNALNTDMANHFILPESNKVYTIVSAYSEFMKRQGAEKAAYDNNGTASWNNLDQADFTMYWYIVPNGKGGYTIQNYNTEKYLTDFNATGETETLWYLSSLGAGEFGICKDSSLSGANFLHAGSHSSGAGVTGNLTNWYSGTGGASAWYIREVSDPNLTAAIAALQNKVTEVNGYVYGDNPGLYPSDKETAVKNATATAQSVLDGGSSVAKTYQDALAAFNAVLEDVTMNPILAGVYRIESCFSEFTKTKGIAVRGTSTYNGSATAPAWKNADAADIYQYWTFTTNDNVNFKVYSKFANKYVAVVDGTIKISEEVSEAANVTFTSLGKGQFNMFFNENTTPIHSNGWNWASSNEDRQENLTYWGGGLNSCSSWRLIPVTEADELAVCDAYIEVVKNAAKIDIIADATVISPTEFAAPAIVNAAIDAIQGTTDGTITEKGAAYEQYGTVISKYLNAINSYGALMSIPYTSVKGWNSIILPVNWSCPDGWYRFSCNTLVVDTNKLAVASSGGTKNTPMLVYDNVGGKYQFIGYSNGAGTENVTNGWLVGILERANNKTSTEEGKTAYLIDATNQTITKAETASAVAPYHCYILADEVLDYATLLFPSCDKSALLCAIEAATPYTTLIGEGVGKYADANDLPAKLQEATTLNESITDDSYLHQADIDAKTAALNSARNSLTINQPVVGKYYRIRENKTESQYYLTCRNDSPRLTKYGVADANNIFYLDEGKTLLSYSKGYYVTAQDSLDTVGNGCSAVTLKDVDAEGDKFEFYKTNIAGNYGIKDATAAKYLYHWEWSGNNVIVLGNDANDSRCQMLLEEVTTLPRSLNLVGDFYYGTFYAPVAVSYGEGVTCYTAEVVDNYFNLTALEGTIPANTGVIVKANAATADFTIVESAEEAPKQALTGTIKTTAKKNATNPYVFGAKNGALGLYKYSGENLAGHKAYYDAPATVSESNFRLDFGTVTSIAEAIEAAEQDNLYDLSGRRIQKASNGIYIQNGKKHIVK